MVQKYCKQCQKQVVPKSKYNATFWIVLIIMCCCCPCGAIGLILFTVLSSPRCPYCKTKITILQDGAPLPSAPSGQMLPAQVVQESGSNMIF